MEVHKMMEFDGAGRGLVVAKSGSVKTILIVLKIIRHINKIIRHLVKNKCLINFRASAALILS